MTVLVDLAEGESRFINVVPNIDLFIVAGCIDDIVRTWM